jgi:3-phenylpropionate/trans-cinnamate dioxygenase ferredoxin component
VAFVQVCAASDVTAGQSKCYTAAGKRIALIRKPNGDFAALDDSCTHMGASLAEGSQVGEMVACPWHGAMFSLHSGAAAGPPARGGVKAYNVKVEGGNVHVDV